MDERNDKQHERYGRVRKRKTNRTIILILTFSIIMIAIAILGSLLLKGSEEHVILNPADTQPGLTLDDDISSGIEESGKPKSSTDDTEYSARDCAARPLKLSIHSGGIEHACRRR